MPDLPDLPLRFRRLRATPTLRRLVRETRVSASDLVLPLFVEENIDQPVPITSMPGVVRHTEATLPDAVRAAADDGIGAVILFGVSHHKDAEGTDSCKDHGLLARMIKAAKDAAPDMVIIADACFCEYTDHGHCGVVVGTRVDNDLTLDNLAKQAVIAAEAGADIIAPSAMMDGQVAAIRAGLDDAGFTDIPILSYSSKFASALYGPFREAAGSDNFKGDRKTYQMDPANGREALAESLQDELEGADMLMVKPGTLYLDVLANVRAYTDRPVAVYHVSGEYAMIKHAAAAGVLDEQKVVLETLTAFKRAGADLILTYYAREAAAWLRDAN